MNNGIESNKPSLGADATNPKRSSIKILLLLHLLLGFYSLGGVFSKTAANSPMPSAKFFICYGAVLAILAVYALGWQQIIKRMPLSSAYANKAVTVVWGIFWGVILFGDTLTIWKIIGAAVIIVGIAMYAFADHDTQGESVGPSDG